MTDRLFDFTGKVVLITGGSRGMGFEMAKAFAERGADIVITSRKIESCREAAAAIEAMGRRALAYACNVARWDELPGLVDAAYAAFGKVDILVNNAGSSPLAPSSLETSEQLFDRIVHLNFKGPFRLMSLVGSRMVQGEIQGSECRVEHEVGGAKCVVANERPFVIRKELLYPKRCVNVDGVVCEYEAH